MIGGSLAVDLKQRGFATLVTGVEARPEHAARALERGLADRVAPLREAVAEADLIILSTPIDSIKALLPGLLDQVGGSRKVVTDMGSTKAGMGRLVKDHPHRRHYVAAHPMAGTEHSGPEAAHSGLFDHKCAIICDPEQSGEWALQAVNRMFDVLHMPVITMDADEHDVSAAYVSHISHISSFALSLCVLEKERSQKRLLSLAGGGFSSTVRLAKSSAETWVPVFEQNAGFVLEVLDTYIDKLQQFRSHIMENNREGLYELIVQANRIKKILK